MCHQNRPFHRSDSAKALNGLAARYGNQCMKGRMVPQAPARNFTPCSPEVFLNNLQHVPHQ